MRSLRNYDQSSLWKRLDELSRTDAVDRAAVDHLKSSVRKIAEHASWISTQVCRFMPQYTMHEERHFLNVLGISEALLPDNVIARLTPLECALPILAAYTHDLGMALSQAEHDALLDESTEQGKHFASYRTRFDEELRQLDRWRNRIGSAVRIENTYGAVVRTADPTLAAQAQKRIDAIEGHILASYLRDTHTEDDQVHRLRRWLDLIKQETGDVNLFRYGNFDYQRTLALIGISHGRGAPWLRRQLIDGGPDDRFFQPVATGESANLAFPSLLLRLADVMDFDASRAPRILFKHFGIENDVSVLEWKKHQSIIGWTLHIDASGREQPRLRYSAECEHPVHEKAIREFAEVIKAELTNVRVELDAQKRQIPADARDNYDLHLPTLHQDDLHIRAARNPLTDQLKYVYHDLQFRLDQDEIQQLLMGESLYGDPGLCIRELLQNALDALELRELRLKMKQRGEAREPVDCVVHLTKKGWFINERGEEEELHVTLDWGTDEETGQQWLRMTDNGVGMTEDVIKNYFTQIGKSFYRHNPDFAQEREAMRAVGEIVSPISIFGIGILSCFMLAERIAVKTRPSGKQGLDITIDAPGSLFWTKPGSMQSQGTEITLFLRAGKTLVHNADSFRAAAAQAVNQPHSSRGQSDIDPALAAIAWVVWPNYPIVLLLPTEAEPIRLDGEFSVKAANEIDAEQLRDAISNWGLPTQSIDDVRWCYWDWCDRGPNGTGSRVRIWFASNAEQTPNSLPCDSYQATAITQDVLSAFVEASVAPGFTNRDQVLVGGMRLENPGSARMPIGRSVGTAVWIDLRGEARPKLTADRRQAISDENDVQWKTSFSEFTARVRAAIDDAAGASESQRRNVACGICGVVVKDTAEPSESRIVDFLEDLVQQSHRAGLGSGSDALRFAAARFLQFDSLAHQPWLDGDDPHRRTINYAGTLGGRLRTLEGSLDLFRATAAQFGLQRLVNYGDMLKIFQGPPPEYEENEAIRTRSQFFAKFYDRFSSIRNAIHASILQDGFNPDLETSCPVFGLRNLRGHVGDGFLLGPGVIAFELESDDCTVHFADRKGELPTEVVQRGYDLAFPMTAVPLGLLRRECANWRTDRQCRPFGVAPFLFPEVHDLWPPNAELLQQTFAVPHIYCLLPRLELWSKRFADWTDDDWLDSENLSAFWDLSGEATGTPGKILWSRGTHDMNEMTKIGMAAPQFLNADETGDAEQKRAIVVQVKVRPQIKVADLNRILASLPSLGDDGESFAKDVERIRNDIPAEDDPWA